MILQIKQIMKFKHIIGFILLLLMFPLCLVCIGLILPFISMTLLLVIGVAIDGIIALVFLFAKLVITLLDIK